MATLSVKVSLVESDKIFAKCLLRLMKTYDHQKYFPKVLHKNFDGKSKTFLFLNFLTDEIHEN